MSDRTFKDLEHQGWLDKAGAYRDIIGKITGQAIEPILETFGDLSGKRLLDVGSGTGELTAEAAQRGAAAEGVDFAATMIEEASRKHVGVRFREGDAEELPYPDASFDAAVCSFGLLHMQDPERAMAEARRVLKPGGRYTFTVWCGPDAGGDFFKLLMGAIREHGTLEVPLPPAPPMFRFADSDECARTLGAAGFAELRTRVLPLQWRTGNPEDILVFLYKSVVRAPMVLKAQSDEAREKIHSAIVAGAEAYRSEQAIEFAFPAMLATATAA